MPASYPFGLQTVIATSKSRSQPAAFRTSEPRRGFAYFQASGTDTPVFWDVIFRFRKCDAANFIMWFTQDLDRGVLDFEMPIRTEFGLLMHICRFMPDALLDAREMADVFEYRAQIITRAQLIPADALTAWGGVFSGPIPPQSLSAGVAFSLDISTYFSAGLGPFTYSIASGALPAGLTINQSTGVISGTPVVAGQLGLLVFERSGAFCLRQYSNEVDLSVQPPDPFFANVRSLLHFEDAPGTSIPVDAVPGIVWSNSDATKAQVSLLQARFGNSSLARQTTGAGGLYTSHFSSLPGPFTFEFFIKFTSFPFVQRRIFALSDLTGLVGAFVIKADAGFFGVDGATNAASTIPAIAGPWYHVAATYDGANIRLWIDGVLALSYAWTSVMTGAFTFSPGCAFGFNGDFVQHYLDEFRFTSGVARYTAAFAPPIAPFPNS